jgi:glycosyltransferase involved in cell wall biosynthesis
MDHQMNNTSSDIYYDACFISMSDLKTDARTLNIMRTLVKNGMNVCAIAFGTGNDVEKFKEEQIDFFNVPKPDYKKASRKWKYFNKECRKYYDKVKSKVYWASDFFSLKNGIYLSKKYSAELYYDSREIYSAIGSLSNRKFKQYIQAKLELKWVRCVDKVIVTGELDKEYLEKHFDIDVPFYVVKNLPPYKQAVNSNIIREKFNISDDKKILLYQGMLLKGRGIIPVIKALPLLENFVFCLLGEGNLENEIIKTAEELGLRDRVILAGRVDYDKLHIWTCSADIGISINEPISFSYELALPNKLFEYCMAGLPVIVSDLPALKQLVTEYNIGKIISTETTPEEIKNAINEIIIDDNYKSYKENCLTASKKLNFENQEAIILEIFSDMK